MINKKKINTKANLCLKKIYFKMISELIQFNYKNIPILLLLKGNFIISNVLKVHFKIQIIHPVKLYSS